jgi:hypothetical protein
MGNTVTIIISSVITLIRGVSISPLSHTRSYGIQKLYIERIL